MGKIYRRYICAGCGREHREPVSACSRCGGSAIYTSPWQIAYMCQGKRIRKSLPGCTKAQAERVLKRLEGAVAAGEYELSTVPRQTVTAYIESRWWPLHGSRLRSSRNYRWNIDRHIIPTFGDALLDRVTEADVVAWRNELLDGGMSPAGVNRLVYLLSAIYTKAIRWRDTRCHPVKNIAPIPENNNRGSEYQLSSAQYLSMMEQVDAIEGWEETTKTGMKAAVTLAIGTCLRKENLFSLRWDEHVDMTRRTITIPGEESKNGEPVTVPMGKVVYDTLKSLPRSLHSPYVLVNCRGDRFKRFHQNHWIELRAAMHKRDRKFPADFHWHDFRATGASWLIAAGVPERVVMRLMNLKSTRVLSRYDRQAQDRLRHAAETIDGKFSSDTELTQKKDCST